MKKAIRMNESELNRLISESVKRVVNEMNFDKYATLARERAKQGRDQKYLENIDDMTNKALKRDYPSSDGKFPSIHTYAKTPFGDSISQYGDYSDGVNYDPFDYFPFNPENGWMPSPDAIFLNNLEDGSKWELTKGEIEDRPGIDALRRYFARNS